MSYLPPSLPSACRSHLGNNSVLDEGALGLGNAGWRCTKAYTGSGPLASVQQMLVGMPFATCCTHFQRFNLLDQCCAYPCPRPCHMQTSSSCTCRRVESQQPLSSIVGAAAAIQDCRAQSTSSAPQPLACSPSADLPSRLLCVSLLSAAAGA